jgi:hypothetical protein
MDAVRPMVAGTENDGEEEQVPPDAPAHLHGPVGLFDHLKVSRTVRLAEPPLRARDPYTPLKSEVPVNS